MRSGYRRTMNTLYNLTQTRAVMGNDNMVETTQRQLAYYLDLAHADAVSGAFSSDDAARRALNELASKGVGAITYPAAMWIRWTWWCCGPAAQGSIRPPGRSPATMRTLSTAT